LIKLEAQEQFAALDGQPNEHPRATGSAPNRNTDSSNPFTSVSVRISLYTDPLSPFPSVLFHKT